MTIEERGAKSTVWNGKRYVPGYNCMATDLYREVIEGKRAFPSRKHHP